MMGRVDQTPLRSPDGGFNVIVETPRGSRTKFAYDVETGLFRAKKLLAMGFAFPFPFGFFPSTRAEDGDPMDVLLLTDADLPTGSLVRCRLIGGIAIEERAEGSVFRNDRLLAVPLLLHQDRPPFDLSDIPDAQLEDFENFFIAYQVADGKQATVLGRLSKPEAEAAVANAALS
jgi:inorganic pyrophosphatase